MAGNIRSDDIASPQPTITHAYLAKQRLFIEFSNREKWSVDLSHYYYAAPAAGALIDRSYAVRFKVSAQDIRWPNGFRISVKSITSRGVQEKPLAA